MRQWRVTDAERDVLIERLEKTVAELGEHFDAVQVHVSSWDDSGTWTISRGYGNWNARQGMSHKFITQDQADDQAKYIASELQRDE